MDRSLIRYCAVACIVAGGLFAGGSGAVAFAGPTEGGNGVDPSVDGGSTATPRPTTAPRGFQLPKLPPFPGFGTDNTTPRVGSIAPPPMNLPAGLAPAAGPDGGNATPQGPNSVTLPFVIDTATKPAGRQPTRTPVVPNSIVPDSSAPDAVVGADSTANPTPEATTRREPTIDLTSLVPQGVPTGPPITIKNPLPELLPPNLDLNKPLLPQVLPAPLVAILTAAAQQIPLADLVISPALQFVAPPFFSDLLIPQLLSDIVVPTLPLGTTPTSTPTALSMTKLASTPMLGIGAPPADLAPMGMDVMQAPAPQQPPSTPSPRLEPLAPAAPPAAGATPENDPVAFRAGYSDYLRNAGVAQITAIAVPGAAAILLFSLGGGFIGYRQARAGHVIRAEGIARFLRT